MRIACARWRYPGLQNPLWYFSKSDPVALFLFLKLKLDVLGKCRVEEVPLGEAEVVRVGKFAFVDEVLVYERVDEPYAERVLFVDVGEDPEDRLDCRLSLDARVELEVGRE